MTEEQLRWLWLSSLPCVTPAVFYRLLANYQEASAVYDAASSLLPGLVSDAVAKKIKETACDSYTDHLLSSLDAIHARTMLLTDDDYPPLLSDIPLPPPVLYIRGEASPAQERAIAIVGTRRPTRTGTRAAGDIARCLAGKNVAVVSGLAYGIDAAAHEGALDAGGCTIAVLGSPIDDITPHENERLGWEIIDHGGAVLSEYAPGTPYNRSHFPMRNRIISGLSSGTLLVEGAHDSGGMITVDRATEQGRDVFAVPGALYIPQSEAPNRLLFDGAQPVLSGDDILTYYRWGESKRKDRHEASALPVEEPTEEEKPILSALHTGEMSLDELCRALGMPVSALAPLLTVLEFEGRIEKLPGGTYCLRQTKP